MPEISFLTCKTEFADLDVDLSIYLVYTPDGDII